MEKTYKLKKDVTVTQEYTKTTEAQVTRDEYVAEKIKYFRVLLGFSQGQLAKRTGLSRQSINNIENARHGITISMLEKLCKYFEVESTDILPF